MTLTLKAGTAFVLATSAKNACSGKFPKVRRSSTGQTFVGKATTVTSLMKL